MTALLQPLPELDLPPDPRPAPDDPAPDSGNRGRPPRYESAGDPLVWLASEVLDQAVRTLRKHWKPDLPVDRQPEDARRAVWFLLAGTDTGDNPLVWHELAGMEVLTEMTAEELVRRIMAGGGPTEEAGE